MRVGEARDALHRIGMLGAQFFIIAKLDRTHTASRFTGCCPIFFPGVDTSIALVNDALFLKENWCAIRASHDACPAPYATIVIMLNGAIPLGTLDGANVEMHQVLGDENIFLFGLKAHEVAELKQKGYKSYEYYVHNPELRAVVDQLNVGFGDGVAYDDIARRLLFGDGGAADEYLLLADFESYRDAHARAGRAYQDPKAWNKMSLLNIARSGIFAADRSIRDYADNIWHVPTREL